MGLRKSLTFDEPIYVGDAEYKHARIVPRAGGVVIEGDCETLFEFSREELVMMLNLCNDAQEGK